MAKAVDNIPGEWAKHLRPYLKRKFWKKVRKQSKTVASGYLRYLDMKDGKQ